MQSRCTSDKKEIASYNSKSSYLGKKNVILGGIYSFIMVPHAIVSNSHLFSLKTIDAITTFVQLVDYVKISGIYNHPDNNNTVSMCMK